MTYIPQTPLQEHWHPGGFLVSEPNGHRHIDRVMLGGNQKIYPGTVLGQQTIGSATVTAGAGNVGNGTVGAITLSQGAVNGNYILSFESATAYTVSGAGSGSEIGHGVVGTAFNAGGVTFTVTAGSTAFALNDEFILVLGAGTGNYVPITATAVDGSQNACAVAYGFTDTTNGPVPAAAVVRECEVNASELVWDPSMVLSNQSTALLQLKALGIIPR